MIRWLLSCSLKQGFDAIKVIVAGSHGECDRYRSIISFRLEWLQFINFESINCE